MCGRYSYFGPLSILKEGIRIDVVDEEPGEDYNIAPARKVPVVLQENGQNHLRHLNWGLIPFWAKDPKIGSRMINARLETITEKPSFRNAFRKRRCLILSNGYYEWKGTRGNKQPYFITPAREKPFGFAGLWEIWRNKADETAIQSCTIITTGACEQIAHIHHRMPVVLDREFHGKWLDPEFQDPVALEALLREGIVGEFTFHPVSNDVNSARNNGPHLIRPIKSDRTRLPGGQSSAETNSGRWNGKQFPAT